MSVLIQMNNEYFLLTKGADSSVAERSLNGKAEQLPQSFSENIDLYLDIGLRVMFMGIRILSYNEV